jgi:thioredoxin reductase
MLEEDLGGMKRCNGEIKTVLTNLDTAILGCGPSAYVAGIYARIANMRAAIIEDETLDSLDFQGASRVVSHGINMSNTRYVELLREQARKFDVIFVPGCVMKLTVGPWHVIETQDHMIRSKTCIIDERNVAIENLPNSMFNIEGLVITHPGCSVTDIPGLFVCGGAKESVKEAIVLSGSGCMAALDAKEYIDRHPIGDVCSLSESVKFV